jgi:hypothetical protein
MSVSVRVKVRAPESPIRVLGMGSRAMASGVSLENKAATKSGVPSTVQQSPKIDSIVFVLPTVTEVKSWSTRVLVHLIGCQAHIALRTLSSQRTHAPVNRRTTDHEMRAARNLFSSMVPYQRRSLSSPSSRLEERHNILFPRYEEYYLHLEVEMIFRELDGNQTTEERQLVSVGDLQ